MPRFKSSYPEHQVYEDWVDLHPEAAVVASGTGTVIGEIPSDVRAVEVHAHVEPSLAVGDTFDLYVQTRFDDLWIDVVHFTRVLGNGVDVDLYDKIVISLAQAHFEAATGLAADGKRNLMGDAWRCRWSVGGATPSFVFSCSVHPM